MTGRGSLNQVVLQLWNLLAVGAAESRPQRFPLRRAWLPGSSAGSQSSADTLKNLALTFQWNGTRQPASSPRMSRRAAAGSSHGRGRAMAALLSTSRKDISIPCQILPNSEAWSSLFPSYFPSFPPAGPLHLSPSSFSSSPHSCNQQK